MTLTPFQQWSGGLLLGALAFGLVRVLRRRWQRRQAFAADGFVSGRREHKYWIYEEMQGRNCLSLTLKLDFEEPDHYTLVVPDEAAWRRSMPLWARDRRREIVQRIALAWPSQDVRYPADWDAGNG